MKYLLITSMFILFLNTGTVEASNETEVLGNYEYGAQLAKSAFGRGCLGCHSIDKFEGSSADEILDRLIASWHASGYTDEDLRDLSVYLSKEVETQ
jgi:cytochrome c553